MTTYPLHRPHTRPSPAPTRPPVPHGPLARWLRHPGAAERRWWHHLTHTLAAQERHLLIALAVASGLVLTGLVLRVAGRAATVRHGHWLQVDPPAQPDPDGGLALWRQLAPLLSTRRTWTGMRPPVAMEWIAETGRLRVGLWCSKTLGLAAAREAIQTAWPGAHVTDADPGRLLARRVAGRRQCVRCGVVRLALPHWYPFATDPTSHGRGTDATGDPLRGLLTALAATPPGSVAVLQVLAHPAPSRTLRRARRAVRALRSDTPGRSGLFGALRVPPTGQPAGPADPIALSDARTTAAKLTDAPLFHTSVRVALTTGGGRAQRRARTAWARHVAGALGLYSGRQRLLLTHGVRVRHAIRHRQPGRGFLASVHELAALTHLPAEPSRYGMSIAAARGVAPPAELTNA